MRSEQLATPQDWAEAYRSQFGPPRVHVTAPGLVVLPLVDQIAAVNTPEPARSNVILPTGFGRHTHEGRWWARPPQRAESLPLLSEVVEAVVTIL